MIGNGVLGVYSRAVNTLSNLVILQTPIYKE